MPKLIMTKGLPASGKSTWAIEQVDKFGWKRVSKDSLRLMLDNNKWSGKNEKFVLALRNTIVVESLKLGKNVIVDDTNLNPIHEEFLRELAKENKSEFVIQDFTDVPLEECLKRDQKRANYVGEKVIKDMYKKFLFKQEVYVPNPLKPLAILCDIDGTLAIKSDRSPFDWYRVGEDKLNKAVFDAVQALSNHGYSVVIVSGRDSICRDETDRWLTRNAVPFDKLLMRPEGDTRKDSVVKKEIFDQIKDEYQIKFVLDDRNQVVEMWRSLGLQCFQVAEGDF